MLYQTVGGAVIVPLYLLTFTYTSSRTAYLDKVSIVRSTSSRTLIPAVILGYLLPTALMFYPFQDLDYTMFATALWQPSPILVNIVWILLASITSSGSKAGNVLNAYLMSGLLAAASHLVVLYQAFSSSCPDVTVTSIFIPIERTTAPFEEAVHFIFQIDYLLIFIATSIWCIQTILALQTRLGRNATVLILAVLLGVPTIGPAATLSGVWYWREKKLARLEAGKGREGK